MKFGQVSVAAGEGAILAHAVKAPGVTLKKGDRLRACDVAALRQAGIEAVVAAALEPDDVVEDRAAAGLAERIAGDHVTLERPFTGRCNLVAARSGLVVVDTSTIHAVNSVDEAITVATLPIYQPVAAGEMIATVKIIPFAVPRGTLDQALAAAPRPPISVAPFLPLRVAVVSTLLSGLKGGVIDKTLRVLDERLEPAGARIVADLRVDHEITPLAAALGTIRDADLCVIFGATAITDRRDIVPAAIERAGGMVEHFGMPVDPGNLLLLGRLGDAPDGPPVIGAPGCARSTKENGFDFVLRRLLVGLRVTGVDLRSMGVGGLLNEIATRPQRRRIVEA